MEGTVIFGFGLLALGLFFCWLAWRFWRYRDQETISVLEAAILKVTGAEPLPRTKVDRWLGYFQMIMASLFGVLLVGFSIYGLFEEAGVI
ncbi:MAG TPA: hypothetical protein VFS87_00920 [Qipengyuania sp.]|nr:hypothetical protein [Qipengyuania sp.]